MQCWRKLTRSVRDVVMFLGFIFSPGVITGLVVFEAIYWTSPEWAQKIGFPTNEGDKIKAVAACTKLLTSTCKTEVVHDGGIPIPLEGLPEWTPVRVEQRFESGLTVVSSLGPHGNFQYVVRDLSLAEDTTFRVVNGAIVKT